MALLNNNVSKNSSILFVQYMVSVLSKQLIQAMEYVNTRMVTWYWKLMEKFGFTTRDELLNNYSNMTEAWEDELEKRVATADKYDYEIEISADRRKEIDPIKVWEPIANLEMTKENALEVTKAKVKVKELKSNDFQHRF